jgi:glycosyltransferase involved in cell wall biosynthesis
VLTGPRKTQAPFLRQNPDTLTAIQVTDMTDEIWLLLDTKKIGGIESHVLQLASGLKCYNMAVRVVFLSHYGEHPLRARLQDQQVESSTLSGGFRGISRALKQHHPALLHTHGYKSGVLGRLAARRYGIPVISTYHAGEIPSGRVALYDWLDRMSAGLATAVYAVSPEIAARLPVKSMIADNFVNTDKLQRSQGCQIAYVGRLSHEKGPDRFLRFAGHYPQQMFDLYGEGPMAEALMRKAGNNVRLHGLQQNMATIWPRIGLLVMPSRHEGLPMAALEAMARGIPVLASEVGALPKLIRQDCNGWLKKQTDERGFIEQIGQWLAMSETDRNQLGENAHQHIVQNYSTQAVVPGLLRRYHQAIAH